MAHDYPNQSGRSDQSRGGRDSFGSDRDRYRSEGEHRFSSDRDERYGNRGYEADRSPSSGGYSEEFRYRRSRNRDDMNDRELGSRYYGSRGSSGANYQSGRSYGGDYDREGQSRYDEGRFDEGSRFTQNSRESEYGNRDYGDAQFTLRRDRGTSTSRWHEDQGDGGGYFNTGSYVDDGGASRGFGRDFERARARVQQERDFGSQRDRQRETSGDYGSYGRSSYGAQSNYGRGSEQDRPWEASQRGSYDDRSSWNYGGSGQRAGSGSAGGAYGRDAAASASGYGSFSGGQSYRGRGPQGYQRSDERLKEMICERLTDDPAIDASNVNVEVTGQTVKLSGTVDDRSTKYEIEELVENFGGVKDIDNQLRVQSSWSSHQASGSSSQQQQQRSDSASGSTTRNEGRSGTSSGASTTGSPSTGSTGRKN